MVIQPGNEEVPLTSWLRDASLAMGGDSLRRRQLNVFHWNGNVVEDAVQDAAPPCGPSQLPTAFQAFGNWRAATIRGYDPVTCRFELKYHDEPKRSKAYVWLPLAVLHFARNPPASVEAIRHVPGAPAANAHAATSVQEDQDDQDPGPDLDTEAPRRAVPSAVALSMQTRNSSASSGLSAVTDGPAASPQVAHLGGRSARGCIWDAPAAPAPAVDPAAGGGSAIEQLVACSPMQLTKPEPTEMPYGAFPSCEEDAAPHGASSLLWGACGGVSAAAAEGTLSRAASSKHLSVCSGFTRNSQAGSVCFKGDAPFTAVDTFADLPWNGATAAPTADGGSGSGGDGTDPLGPFSVQTFMHSYNAVEPAPFAGYPACSALAATPQLSGYFGRSSLTSFNSNVANPYAARAASASGMGSGSGMCGVSWLCLPQPPAAAAGTSPHADQAARAASGMDFNWAAEEGAWGIPHTEAQQLPQDWPLGSWAAAQLHTNGAAAPLPAPPGACHAHQSPLGCGELDLQLSCSSGAAGDSFATAVALRSALEHSVAASATSVQQQQSLEGPRSPSGMQQYPALPRKPLQHQQLQQQSGCPAAEWQVPQGLLQAPCPKRPAAPTPVGATHGSFRTGPAGSIDGFDARSDQAEAAALAVLLKEWFDPNGDEDNCNGVAPGVDGTHYWALPPPAKRRQASLWVE